MILTIILFTIVAALIFLIAMYFNFRDLMNFTEDKNNLSQTKNERTELECEYILNIRNMLRAELERKSINSGETKLKYYDSSSEDLSLFSLRDRSRIKNVNYDNVIKFENSKKDIKNVAA